MISETAIESLDDMIAEGLKPTPRDIVRLNAMGLKLEAAKAKDQIDSTWYLPRVARISRDVFFRQPAVGHDIWLQKAGRWCDMTDPQTVLALDCYALSRPPEDLCDGDDPANVERATAEYAQRLSSFTREQLYAAITYVRFGYRPEACERPPLDDDSDDVPDVNLCVAVGWLNHGAAILSGITLADLRTMPLESLRGVVRQARARQGDRVTSPADKAEEDFYSTLNEIHDRLAKEKSDGGK